MIRKLIRRILGTGSAAGNAVAPNIYEKSVHGILLDDVSNNAIRVTQTLQQIGRAHV
jgi:hypothetical protein